MTVAVGTFATLTVGVGREMYVKLAQYYRPMIEGVVARSCKMVNSAGRYVGHSLRGGTISPAMW